MSRFTDNVSKHVAQDKSDIVAFFSTPKGLIVAGIVVAGFLVALVGAAFGWYA